ncbi:hypothetical protein CPB86DRAFT_57580 [Serendipita vermifera]|nr:hypothetical protein CPB86DRAFT_57580 [Serendipita vermifera]
MFSCFLGALSLLYSTEDYHRLSWNAPRELLEPVISHSSPIYSLEWVPQPMPEGVFHGILELESLHNLSNSGLGEGFVNSLQDCRRLYCLAVEHCITDEFMELFTECLMCDNNSSPEHRL